MTYSSAISLKMSFAPHAPCIFSTIGDCATEIIGKLVIAAPVAPAAAVPMNLRRDGTLVFLAGTAVPSGCDVFV